MPEYIDRNKIHYTWWQKKDGTFTDGVTLQSVIRDMPTVDAVEVVRCKDCIYQDDCARQMVHTTRDYVLEQNISTYKKVDFCSCGERKIDYVED